jgi:hypothetical protein
MVFWWWRNGGLKIYDNCTPGLGNQLFQYTAGLYFQRRWKGDLALLEPAEEYCQSEGQPRPYQLDKFRIACPSQKASKYRRFVQTASTGAALQMARGLVASTTQSHVIREKELYRFEGDLSAPSGARSVYIWGYWQAWQYAAAVEDEVRRDLTLNDAATGKNLDYLKLIQDSRNTVSVHLRRGDYTVFTTGSGEKKRGLVLDDIYYRRALEYLREQLGDLTLVVFSDDQAFARQAIVEPGTIYVEGNDALTAYEDLRLMAACEHHIIANSTFSWWGAWLNGNEHKLVAAPKYWTNQENSYFPDLFPPNWKLIDNIDL